MPQSMRTRFDLRRSERAEHRRLAAADRRSAMLGRLATVRDVLTGAEQVVAAGWVQCAWYVEPRGDSGAAACLVGAIVHAAGGRADTECAQKAIGAAWAELLGRDDAPDRAVAPAVRLARIRELTAWNDAPGRTGSDVRALLAAAGRRVEAARRAVLCTPIHS